MIRSEVPDARWSKVGAPLAAQAVANRAPARPALQRSLTGRPTATRGAFVNSALVWLTLMAVWSMADLLLTHYPPGPGGRQLPPDGLTALGVYAVLGLAGIWCAHQTGFPAAWDARLPMSRRLVAPLVL